MLWRDEPLPELRTEPFSAAAVAQLEQLRLGALEERIDADLALGRQAELVTELESLVAEHPYRERLRAQLMLALYRSGRQADALDAYQAGRRVLQDDLGLEPGNELRDLEAAILRHDEALSPALPVPAATPISRRRHAASRDGQSSPRASAASRRLPWAGGHRLSLAGVGRHAGPPESVGVVDPVARRVVEEIPVGFSSPLIAAGERRVWLVDDQGNTLTGIDPETNDFVLARRGISTEGLPTGLAAGFGSVWIALVDGNVLRLLEVGPGDRRRAPTDRPSKRRDDPYSEFIRIRQAHGRRGRRLGLERGLRRVTRIDPDTGKTSCSRRTSEPRRRSQSTGMPSGSEAATGCHEARFRDGYELESTPTCRVLASATTSIAVDRDAVWFVGDSSHTLWRIDPETVSILDSLRSGQAPARWPSRRTGPCGSPVGRPPRSGAWIPRRTTPETIPLGATSGGLVADFGRIWTSPGASAA